MTLPSDDDLVLRSADGDTGSFRILVARWERPIYAFLERMTGSREEAQDLTQETFLKLYQNASRYRPSGKFKSWLFRIAGNLARSRLRRNKIVRWIPLDLADHDLKTPGDAADRALEREETGRSVRSALLQLPARQREAVLLWQYEELSHGEIGEVMGINANAVAQIIHRATTRLRAILSIEEVE